MLRGTCPCQWVGKDVPYELDLNLFAIKFKMNMNKSRNEKPRKSPREPPIAVKMSPASNCKEKLMLRRER